MGFTTSKSTSCCWIPLVDQLMNRETETCEESWITSDTYIHMWYWIFAWLIRMRYAWAAIFLKTQGCRICWTCIFHFNRCILGLLLCLPVLWCSNRLVTCSLVRDVSTFVDTLVACDRLSHWCYHSWWRNTIVTQWSSSMRNPSTNDYHTTTTTTTSKKSVLVTATS